MSRTDLHGVLVPSVPISDTRLSDQRHVAGHQVASVQFCMREAVSYAGRRAPPVRQFPNVKSKRAAPAGQAQAPTPCTSREVLGYPAMTYHDATSTSEWPDRIQVVASDPIVVASSDEPMGQAYSSDTPTIDASSSTE